MCKELIANLITDMIMGGATKDELDSVLRYSVGVMDAEKKYNIDKLREKYPNTNIEVPF